MIKTDKEYKLSCEERLCVHKEVGRHSFCYRINHVRVAVIFKMFIRLSTVVILPVAIWGNIVPGYQSE
jgi:hypothetical protein